MKASQAGVGITDRMHRVPLHFPQYIRDKYEGLIPDDYPTEKEYKDVCRTINYHQRQPKDRRDDEILNKALNTKHNMDKIILNIGKEWMRQQ